MASEAREAGDIPTIAACLGALMLGRERSIKGDAGLLLVAAHLVDTHVIARGKVWKDD